jgi:hypothetical protein
VRERERGEGGRGGGSGEMGRREARGMQRGQKVRQSEWQSEG